MHGNFGGTSRAVITARACRWPPSVSRQPRLPRGFYREWQCRIKYSLSPAGASASSREMSWSRQHCLSPTLPHPHPLPPGPFHKCARDKTTKERRRPSRAKLCLLISWRGLMRRYVRQHFMWRNGVNKRGNNGLNEVAVTRAHHGFRDEL